MRNWIMGWAAGLALIAAMALAEGRLPGHQAPCDLKVERISDGDTFYSWTETRISPTIGSKEWTGFRLARVYAPERGQPGYKAAKEKLRKLVEGKLVAVDIVPVGRFRIREKYGRYMVEVWLCGATGKVGVNDKMREAGYIDRGRGVKK